MRKKWNIISCLLAVAMTLSLLPVHGFAVDSEEAVVEAAQTEESVPETNESPSEEQAEAEDVSPETMASNIASGTCGKKVKWKLSSNGTLTISGTGAMYNYEESGKKAPPYQKWRKKIKKIVIKDGVTVIGENAFFNDTAVKSVEISKSVQKIKEYAFWKCGFTKITIPPSVTEIEYEALGYTVEEGTDEPVMIANFTIYGYRRSEAHAYARENRCAFKSLGEVDAPVTGDCGKNLTWKYDKKSNTLTISGTGKMYSDWPAKYKDRAPWFHYLPEVQTIVIESGVENIAVRAFEDCEKLTKVVLPDTLKEIGYSAFDGGKALKSVTIPPSVMTIGDCAFGYYWTESNDEDTVAMKQFKIYGYTYSGAQRYAKENNFLFESIGERDVPESGKYGSVSWRYDKESHVLTISGTEYMDGFDECSDTPWYWYVDTQEVVIESGMRSIEDNAFCCCGLERVTIPAGVMHIGDNAFLNCDDLKEVTIPTSVDWIGDNAFYCCGLKKVTIPASVTEIGWEAFYPGTVIYGYSGTEAEKYAEENRFKFVALFGAPSIKSLTNTDQGVKIGWRKVSDAKGYYIYRRTGKGDFEKVTTTSANTWTDPKAKSNGTKYRYKVYAYREGEKSGALKAKTIYYLSAPKLSSVKNSGTKKATVKWGKNTKASGYEIQYSTASSFKGAKTVKVSSYKKTSATLSKLTKKKKYYVRVRAYKTVSGTKYVSAWSGSKNVTIKK